MIHALSIWARHWLNCEVPFLSPTTAAPSRDAVRIAGADGAVARPPPSQRAGAKTPSLPRIGLSTTTIQRQRRSLRAAPSPERRAERPDLAAGAVRATTAEAPPCGRTLAAEPLRRRERWWVDVGCSASLRPPERRAERRRRAADAVRSCGLDSMCARFAAERSFCLSPHSSSKDLPKADLAKLKNEVRVVPWTRPARRNSSI